MIRFFSRYADKSGQPERMEVPPAKTKFPSVSMFLFTCLHHFLASALSEERLGLNFSYQVDVCPHSNGQFFLCQSSFSTNPIGVLPFSSIDAFFLLQKLTFFFNKYCNYSFLLYDQWLALPWIKADKIHSSLPNLKSWLVKVQCNLT